MRPRGPRFLALAAVTIAATALAACGSITGSSTTSSGLAGPAGKPVTIGISLPLTGQFQVDGQATQRGYELWVSDVNAHGGLLGRPVKLFELNDKSDPGQTAKDYTTLITTDHVDLTLAPFSSLLTVAAARVTTKYRYALPAGSAGAPAVYGLNSHTLFSTTVPVAIQALPLVNWIKSLPASRRPRPSRAKIGLWPGSGLRRPG